jgi:hypothetical protein
MRLEPPLHAARLLVAGRPSGLRVEGGFAEVDITTAAFRDTVPRVSDAAAAAGFAFAPAVVAAIIGAET